MSLRFSIFVVGMVFFSRFAYPQDEDINITPKIFRSLNEASLNPDSVFYLDLSKKKLKEFPMEIFKFKNLVELNLSKNKISEIPGEIGELQKLKKFNISNNKLKTLPDGIGALVNLKELNLNRNIIDTLPEAIGKLISLEKLYMWDNELSEIPDEVRNLKNLSEFELRGILFSDEEQKRIHDLLPNCIVYFSPSCACKN